MNMRTTFMLMAATVVAPLSAQQPTESAADVFQTLASAQPAAIQATAEQRAAAFPALKTVPADVEAFSCFTHLVEHLSHLQHVENLLGEEDGPLRSLDGFSLALGKGSSASLNAISPLLLLSSAQEQTETVTQLWASQAKGSLSGVLFKVAADALMQQQQKAQAQAPEVLVHPIYLTLAFKPSEHIKVQDWANSLVSDIQRSASHVDEVGEPIDPSERAMESVDINGMSGIRIKGSVFSRGEEDSGEGLLGKELEKRAFYLLVRSDATSISIVFCENPDEVHFASRPEESVLYTDKLASTAVRPGALAAVYASPELTGWNQSFSLQSFMETANVIRTQFEQLGLAEPSSKEAYDKASAVIGQLLGPLEKFYRATPGAPTLMQVWTEEGRIFLESTSPLPEGVSYLPTRLRLTGMADAANTIFYMESGSVQRQEPLPSAATLLDGVSDVARAVLLTLPEQKQDEYSAQWQMINSFLPDAKELASAMELMGSGLSGSTALVVDAGGSLPPILGGTPGNKIAIPRVSVCSGVSDRSRLAEAWQRTLAVAGNVAVKLGQDPAVIGMLPIMPMSAGDAMSYSVALPFFTEDLAPNATVSDTTLALGSSPALNSRVVESATGTVDFTGAVFSFNPAPLAASLRAMADSLAASLPEDRTSDCVELDDTDEEASPDVVVDSGATQAEEAADEAASTDEEPAGESPDEGDEDADDDDEEEVEGVDLAEVELTPAEVSAMERAENVEDAAEFAEFLSRNVESIRGVLIPAGEGAQTLRIEVKLR